MKDILILLACFVGLALLILFAIWLDAKTDSRDNDDELDY